MAEAPVTEGIGDVTTQCTCKINKKDYTVTVTKSYLKWYVADSKEQKDFHNVRIEDILSAKLQSASNLSTDSDSVNVSYVKQEKKLYLKLCSVVFRCADLQIVTKLHQQILDLVGNVQQRPKKLLVLINPVSGGSKGRSVYEQKVAPIFQDADIETEVIVTEKAHHTEEILLTYDISTIDGLVVVGGDGLYHEAVNGLMQKLTKDQGLNVDDPDIVLPEIHLRIGLIPCGTGNGIAAFCYGNYDVTTAALSIVIGYQMDSSMIAVHSGGRLVAFSILMIGYGAWGDMIHTTETKRHQGRLRYAIAMFQHMFIKPLRRLNLTIQYVADDTSANIDSAENIKEDKKTTEENVDDKNEGDDTEKANVSEQSGEQNLTAGTRNEIFFGLMIFMLNPASALTYNTPGLPHGAMYLNKSALRRKFFSFMVDLMMQNFESVGRREDITVLPGKEWTMKLNEPSQPDTETSLLEHIMNIDGEMFKLPQPEFQAKLLPQKIKLFSNTPVATKREKTSQ